jgi:hypothetical protein
MSLIIFNEGLSKRGGNLQKARRGEKMRFHMDACFYATGWPFLWRGHGINPKLKVGDSVSQARHHPNKMGYPGLCWPSPFRHAKVGASTSAFRSTKALEENDNLTGSKSIRDEPGPRGRSIVLAPIMRP